MSHEKAPASPATASKGTKTEKAPPEPKRPAYPPEVRAYVEEEGQDPGIVTRLAVLHAPCQPSNRADVVAWLRAHGCPENFIPDAPLPWHVNDEAREARAASVQRFEEGGRQPRRVLPPDAPETHPYGETCPCTLCDAMRKVADEDLQRLLRETAPTESPPEGSE
jgi:hypothetical protein